MFLNKVSRQMRKQDSYFPTFIHGESILNSRSEKEKNALFTSPISNKETTTSRLFLTNEIKRRDIVSINSGSV